jgi:hypothetical protein
LLSPSGNRELFERHIRTLAHQRRSIRGSTVSLGHASIDPVDGRSSEQHTIHDDVYVREQLPRELEIQVLAFMRLTWGEALFCGEDRFRERLWEDAPATHFVRVA